VVLSDQLEKQLRFKTIERFGGKKGDLTRAVEEAVKTDYQGINPRTSFISH
jgi:hypothetical protein